LLETLFAAFDEIASRRRVFKVETVGDCYVAVAGLPDPRKDHAIVMARFARDVLYKMNDLTKKLEVTLGPDTGDLSLRIGLHSGQVTAGVLRGDKSRFQLFGDTMNTAARIESNGQRNRIHVSSETANLIMSSGKDQWVTERDDKINAKGKGELTTYWLSIKSSNTGSSKGSSNEDTSVSNDNSQNEAVRAEMAGLSQYEDGKIPGFDAKTLRLVDWNSDVLARLLRQVVARRLAKSKDTKENTKECSPALFKKTDGTTVLDEVQEIIHLPEFEAEVARRQVEADSVDLGEDVMLQLRGFVTIVATMYKDNPFHNFEHASHVTMSVVKLLSRIVAPDIEHSGESHDGKIASTLHDHTYGITSDPLTQFACVFSALIHDVDHSGKFETFIVAFNITNISPLLF